MRLRQAELRRRAVIPRRQDRDGLEELRPGLRLEQPLPVDLAAVKQKRDPAGHVGHTRPDGSGGSDTIGE